MQRYGKPKCNYERAGSLIGLDVGIKTGIRGIGRYRASDYKETCVCIRGHFEEYMYGFAETQSDGTPDPNSFGIVETVDMYPGGPILNI
jgi:hypothetical protein